MENLGTFKSVMQRYYFAALAKAYTNVMIQEHLKLSARNVTVQER